MKKSIVLLFAMLTSLSAHADFSTISIAARIRAFDADDVIIEHDRKLYKVPREVLVEKDIKTNDAATLILNREDFEKMVMTEGRPKLSAPAPLSTSGGRVEPQFEAK